MRTVVVTVSPLLADLVIEVLSPRVPIEVVATLPSRAGLLHHLLTLAPDLVVLGLYAAESDALTAPLLAALPATLFLVLAPDARRAWLHGRRNQAMLFDFSVTDLVEALAARFPSEPPQG